SSKKRFQYGVFSSRSVIAFPIAGICDVVTPPTILAIPVSSLALELLGQAFALREQLGLELLGRDALERGACVLHGEAAGDGELREVVDVRAETQHPEEVVLEQRLLLLGRKPVLVRVRGLVARDLAAALLVVEREQQLVQAVRRMRGLPVEYVRAGKRVVVVFPPAHLRSALL